MAEVTLVAEIFPKISRQFFDYIPTLVDIHPKVLAESCAELLFGLPLVYRCYRGRVNYKIRNYNYFFDHYRTTVYPAE